MSYDLKTFLQVFKKNFMMDFIGKKFCYYFSKFPTNLIETKFMFSCSGQLAM
jgi:hypothetical protein